MAGIVPEDDLPEAEGPAPTLYSKDARMQKTIADIEAGVPAPKVTWQGREIPEYSAPDMKVVPEDDLPSPSNFPGITKITGPGLKAPGENEGLPTQEGKKGFLDTLRNPIDLWKNESMYAHLYKASEKGVFNKPVGELFKSAGEEISKFSLEGLWDAAKENPRQFLGEMVNGIVADPEFLLFPAALGGRVTGAMGVAGSKIAPAIGRVARVAGQVAETGAMGAVGMAPISMARQLDEAGVIDTRTLMTEMKVGAAMGATMGIMFNLGGNALKVKPRKLYEDFKARTAKGVTPDEAIETTLKNFGMKADDAAEYAAKTKEQWEIEYANSLHEAEVAKGKGLPEAGKPSKKEAARLGREAKARIGEEAEGAAIAKGEAERITAEKASTQELLDGIVNPPKTRLAEGVEIGSAKAAELTPPAQRSAEDLIRIRAERQKQPEISLEDFVAAKPAPVDPKKILVPEEGKWKQLGDTEIKVELQARGFEDPDFARMTALEAIPLRREASRGLENFSPAGKMVSKMESGRQRLVQNVEAHRRLNEDLGAVIGQPQRAGDIYKKIAEQSPDPVQREIARVLRPRIHDIDVTVGSKYLDDWNTNALASGRNPAEGLYNPKTQSIHIAADTDAARVALHEGTHAATALYMLRNPNALETRMLTHLHEATRNTLQARGEMIDRIYGLTNPFEFVAEAFSRPAFQQELATIRLPKEFMQLYRGKLGKNPTLWDAFVNTISRIIFGTKKAVPDNVLAATLEVGADIIRKGGGKGERGRMLADLKAQELPSLASIAPDQAGNIDPRLAKALGMTGLAAGIGSFLADDPKEGAAIGAALAVGGMTAALATKKLVGNMLPKLQQIAGKDHRYRIDDMRKTYQSTLAGMKIDVARVAHGLKKMVPDADRRSQLTFFIEEGDPKLAPKTKEEVAYVNLVKETYDKLGKVGQETGVLDTLIKDGKYITHLFGVTGEDLRKAQVTFSNMNPNSRFALRRTLPTLRMAMEVGLKPLTTDSADLLNIYGESLAKSIANRGLIESLKKGVHPDGRPLLMPARRAAPDYVSIPHPQLQAVKVNPEIAPSVELLFSMDNPNAITQKLLEFSAFAKRSLFSFSMFHGMALTEAALAAQGTIPKGIATTGKGFSRIITNKHWLEGQFGKNAEEAAKAGVVLEPHKGIDADSDIFQGLLKRTIESSEGWLSKGRAGLAAGGAGIGALYADDPVEGALAGAAIGALGGRAGLKAAKYVDGKLNTLLWDRIHPTFKILTFMNQKERMLAENAKLAEAGKPTLTPQQINEYAASFVNDTFGGLDWIGIAEGVQNKFGRDIAMAAASPAGRRALSIGLLAPDWTVSTFRSITKAIPGVTQREIGHMHRRYVMNSAILYLTFGDALNLAFSGKHLWENEDPTYIDLGDGRKMQLNKHFMETFHWIQRPGKTFSHKLGAIPRIAGKIAFDPFMNSPKALGKEVVSTMTPIPVSNVATQGEMGTNVLMGALGLPIYGKTNEQKAKDQLEKKIRRQQLLLEKQLEALEKGKR